MHLVQIRNGERRTVAIVKGPRIYLAKPDISVYELALKAIRQGRKLTELAQQVISDESLEYDAVYQGKSDWRLLPPLDHPTDPGRVIVSGTGLTHKVSAENRAAMHQQVTSSVTDSMRMYQMGKEGGNPADGNIGVQPEWFYKGNGLILRAHGDDLEVPAYADDGGEEPEIAGAYVIADDGQPYCVGLTIGNEFSDHVMEKQNYLYLAPSKLRNCSIGPELIVGGRELFTNITGTVVIERHGTAIWTSNIYTGEANMCHTLANLEHHHFKYDMHRRPGDVHIHFFGADAFSFGEKILLKNGDVMEVSFPGFGRSLRNPLRIVPKQQSLIRVHSLM